MIKRVKKVIKKSEKILNENKDESKEKFRGNDQEDNLESRNNERVNTQGFSEEELSPSIRVLPQRMQQKATSSGDSRENPPQTRERDNFKPNYLTEDTETRTVRRYSSDPRQQSQTTIQEMETSGLRRRNLTRNMNLIDQGTNWKMNDNLGKPQELTDDKYQIEKSRSSRRKYPWEV